MAKKNLSYSEAIAQIEEIVGRIENNELDVDELTQSVKKVADLLKLCKAKLRATEEEVEKILKDFSED